jgi:hypothetical protein
VLAVDEREPRFRGGLRVVRFLAVYGRDAEYGGHENQHEQSTLDVRLLTSVATSRTDHGFTKISNSSGRS